jgi:NitT/TauT family transport system ATP-binding protein
MTDATRRNPALEFGRITRDFTAPDGRGYRAIDDLSLSVERGEFVALVGPSGCGKTTLLNLAAGLMAPSSGKLRVNGTDLIGLNRHATYMFQQDALLPWKNVRDNVALGLVLAGQSKADANSRAHEWLERVGLSAFTSHYPSQLSGGMRKRVSMAQNWILDRSQMLMDEPFGALDVHTRQLMESELLALWDQSSRRTILFVTHDLEEAIALADRVVVLSASPASRIVAGHTVDLPRPRDLLDLRTSPAFIELYRTIWATLRDEVVRSQRQTSQHA